MKGVIFTLLVLLVLFGCDAVNRLPYYVENKTKDTIQVYVPAYQTSEESFFDGAERDTVLVLAPNEYVRVRLSAPDIDFPWATKRIYLESPGPCGLLLITEKDTTPLGCTEESWKYKRKTAVLRVR